jgi:hypothetical protein
MNQLAAARAEPTIIVTIFWPRLEQVPKRIPRIELHWLSS